MIEQDDSLLHCYCDELTFEEQKDVRTTLFMTITFHRIATADNITSKLFRLPSSGILSIDVLSLRRSSVILLPSLFC